MAIMYIQYMVTQVARWVKSVIIAKSWKKGLVKHQTVHYADSDRYQILKHTNEQIQVDTENNPTILADTTPKVITTG